MPSGRESLTNDKALVQPFLITTVESDTSDEMQINFTIVVIDLWVSEVFGNIINMESN